jgi:hypothetical protein
MYTSLLCVFPFPFLASFLASLSQVPSLLGTKRAALMRSGRDARRWSVLATATEGGGRGGRVTCRKFSEPSGGGSSLFET